MKAEQTIIIIPNQCNTLIILIHYSDFVFFLTLIGFSYHDKFFNISEEMESHIISINMNA